MLPSFTAAFNVFGRQQKAIAYDCGVKDRTFYKWGTGRLRVPNHKRQSVDRALGGDTDGAARVDWAKYDIECAEFQDTDPKIQGWAMAPKSKHTDSNMSAGIVEDDLPTVLDEVEAIAEFTGQNGAWGFV
jgi:DNA-binding transcriptional regulator YdaS (Cro superfamily)